MDDGPVEKAEESCHAPVSVPRRTGEPNIVVFGNPNAGKSTLFNALTGGGAQVGNFAGTTVEWLAGHARIGGVQCRIVDVPGTFSLAARSPEERVAIDTLLGLGGEPRPDVVLVVADAPRVVRSLYLTLQLLELELPVVMALNLYDEARASGTPPDPAALAKLLNVPVIPTVARTGEGLDALRAALSAAIADPRPAEPVHGWPAALEADVDAVVPVLPAPLAAAAVGSAARARALARWLVLSEEDETDRKPTGKADLDGVLGALRDTAAQAGRDLQLELVTTRWTWIDSHAPGLFRSPLVHRTLDDTLDRLLLHPVSGTLVFLAVMSAVFTALFSWSDPAIGAIEATFGAVGDGVSRTFDLLGATGGLLTVLHDAIVDGLIGGVGSVVVFLPQIGLLFFFLALLEDSGYLARAAHLMDRILRLAGLPGQAFVPLLSGYACAVPAILATRTMPRQRDRLLTMLVVPLTSCSARLPVYALMIGALFPPTALVFGFNLPFRPLALMGMYLFSTVVTVAAAIILGRLVLPADASSAVLELPPYRWPHLPTVARLVWRRCAEFLQEAGRTILVATLVLWALLYFPRYQPADLLPPDVMAAHAHEPDVLDALAAPLATEASFAGRIGHAMEPIIAPLGYDWKIGVGLIGAFAAREVFVSTLGVVYGMSDVDEEDASLREQMQAERHSDGSKVYTPLVGASIMVFFALAMQCLSTLAVLRKESRGWKWPVFVVGYMTALAWISVFAVYQGGRLLGFA